MLWKRPLGAWKGNRLSSLLDKYISRYTGFALLACLIIGFCMLLFSAHELDSSIAANERQRLQVGVTYLDDQFESLREVYYTVKSVAYYRPFYFQRNTLYEKDLIDDLAKRKSYSPLIDDIRLVYLAEPGYVYGMEYKTKLNVYASQLKLSDENSFIEAFLSVREMDVLVPQGQDNLIFIAFYTNILGARDHSGDAVLLFTIRQDVLLEQLERMSSIPAQDITDIVYRGVSLLGASRETGGDASARPREQSLSENGITLTIRAQSFYTNERFHSFSLIGVSVILIVMILLTGLAVIAARRSYRPIRRLVDRFNLSPENEFRQIEDLLDSLHHSNEVSRQTIVDLLDKMGLQRKRLKEYLTLALLGGETFYATPSQMENVGFNTSHAQYCVAILQIDEQMTEPDEIVRYIELTSDVNMQMHAVCLSDESHIAIIISGDGTASLQEIDEILEDVMRSRGIAARISLGTVVESLTQVAVSFQNAFQKMSVWDEDEVSTFTADTVDHIVRGAEAGRKEEADRALDAMCESIASNHLMHNLRLSIFMQTGDRLTEAARRLGIPDNPNEYHRLLLVGDYEKFLEQCHETIDRIATAVQDQENETTTLSQDDSANVLRYIESNACDNQFSQRAVAANFHISERQVSRIVREVTGQTYKDYVINVRIQKAKELLHSGVSVAKTAEQIGYAHIPHFIKMFKEIVGVTPGNYQAGGRSKEKPD